MSVKKEIESINFSWNFSIMMLKFLFYFCVTMFLVGCSMVFLSIERNKMVPVILVFFGILVFVFLILERKLLSAGLTQIDAGAGTITQRCFSLKRRITSCDAIDHFVVQRMFIEGKVLLYTVFVVLKNGKKIGLGQERDLNTLQQKMRCVQNMLGHEIIREDVFHNNFLSFDFKKLVAFMIPLAVIFIVRAGVSATALQKNKFLIVILIPMSYLVLHWVSARGRNK